MEWESPDKTVRSRWLTAAAALIAVTTLVHVFAGGPENYTPLRNSAITPVARSTLSVVWHAITLMLALTSFGLWWLTNRREPGLWWVLFSFQAGFSLLFVIYGLADFGDITTLPQWIAFSLGAALMWMGR